MRTPAPDLRAPFVAFADQFDRMFGPVDGALLRAAEVAPGDRLLDIGCGAGGTSIAASTRLGPVGASLGVDLDPDAIEAARRRARARGAAQAKFIVADAGRHAFFEGASDVLLSRLGGHLFDAPEDAYRNLATALRPGGRLAIAALDGPARNLWALLPFEAAAEVLGVRPAMSTGGRGPFSWADPTRPRRVLEAAGFSDVVVERLERPLCVGATVQDALRFFEGTHLRKVAAKAPSAAVPAIVAALGARLEEHATEAGVFLPSSVWVIRGRKP